MRFYLFAALVPLFTVTALPAEPGFTGLDFRRAIEKRNNDGKVVQPKINFDTWEPYNTTKCSKKVVKSCAKRNETCSKSPSYVSSIQRHLLSYQSTSASVSRTIGGIGTIIGGTRIVQRPKRQSARNRASIAVGRYHPLSYMADQSRLQMRVC